QSCGLFSVKRSEQGKTVEQSQSNDGTLKAFAFHIDSFPLRHTSLQDEDHRLYPLGEPSRLVEQASINDRFSKVSRGLTFHNQLVTHPVIAKGQLLEFDCDIRKRQQVLVHARGLLPVINDDVKRR